MRGASAMLMLTFVGCGVANSLLQLALFLGVQAKLLALLLRGGLTLRATGAAKDGSHETLS